MDYQSKIWGGSQVRLKLNYLGYLRLKYALKSLNKLKSNNKILEIGCGGGGFIASIKYYKPNLNCFGVDIGKPAIKFAKKNFTKVHFSISDIYKLKFPNNYFDAVLIEDVLEHLDSPDKAIKEIKRVLKPNGVFHAYIPLEGEKYTLHNLFNKLGLNYKEKIAGHIQNYKFNDIKKILNKNGFRIKAKYFELYLFGQIVDLSYFTFMNITKYKVSSGLEQDLENKSILRFIKNIVTVFVNIESIVFSKFKGAGVHIRVSKI